MHVLILNAHAEKNSPWTSAVRRMSKLHEARPLNAPQQFKLHVTLLPTIVVQVFAASLRQQPIAGPPVASSPPAATDTLRLSLPVTCPDWRESDGREPRRRGHIEAMERLLQQVRATHTHYCCGGKSERCSHTCSLLSCLSCSIWPPGSRQGHFQLRGEYMWDFKP